VKTLDWWILSGVFSWPISWYFKGFLKLFLRENRLNFDMYLAAVVKGLLQRISCNLSIIGFNLYFYCQKHWNSEPHQWLFNLSVGRHFRERVKHILERESDTTVPEFHYTEVDLIVLRLWSIDVACLWSTVMHDVTMKPTRINDNGAMAGTKLLLLFICALIALQCFSVGMGGSVSAASFPSASAGTGRVVKTKHGNLRGLTLPGGAAQPQTTTASPGIFTWVLDDPILPLLLFLFFFHYI